MKNISNNPELLGPILDNKDHWVFVTDNIKGHYFLCGQAMGWAVLGKEEGIVFGCISQILQTLDIQKVSFLAVPKSKMPLELVKQFLKGINLAWQDVDKTKDVIILQSEQGGKSKNSIIDFLCAVRTKTLRVANSE